ncbi:hypothetical protein GCM10023237_41080 [Streptomyces coeruleoprunus]
MIGEQNHGRHQYAVARDDRRNAFLGPVEEPGRLGALLAGSHASRKRFVKFFTRKRALKGGPQALVGLTDTLRGLFRAHLS